MDMVEKVKREHGFSNDEIAFVAMNWWEQT